MGYQLKSERHGAFYVIQWDEAQALRFTGGNRFIRIVPQEDATEFATQADAQAAGYTAGVFALPTPPRIVEVEFIHAVLTPGA